MRQEPEAPQPDARLRFLRVLGTIWLVIMALTLGGAALAPYLGQIADMVLQHTVQRHWTRFTWMPNNRFLICPLRLVPCRVITVRCTRVMSATWTNSLVVRFASRCAYGWRPL